MSIVHTPPHGIIPPLPLQLGAAQSAASAPRTGDVLDGRYLLQEQIGQGGVASVFRALQFRVRRPVAVKFLHSDTLGEHSLKPRFEHEALALAALCHPNIVRLQDYGVSSGMQFLVMELIEGHTLRELIDTQGPFSVERALRLGRQLGHALAYAHEHGIVHRDLKPLNVLVQQLPHQPEHLKVLDFGFAKFLPGSQLERGAPVTHAGFTFGSPAYISPEQCSGDPVDGRADLYAVGVLLFEMLTGTLPYDGEIHELLRHHLSSPVPQLRERRPELAEHPALQALIERALAKKPDQRFANAAEMLSALDAAQPTAASMAGSTRGSAAPALQSLRVHGRAQAIAAVRASAVAARWLADASMQAWHEHGRPLALKSYALSRTHAITLAARARVACAGAWAWTRPRVVLGLTRVARLASEARRVARLLRRR